MNKYLRGMALVAGTGLAASLAGRHLLRRSRFFSFQDKTVLITGASRGLGLVLARHLVDAGARVAICARDARELEQAGEELKIRGGQVLPLVCDVSDQQQVDKMIAQVNDHWGPIDVLINNAGIIQVGPLDAMTLDDFRQAMDTHCWAALYTALAVLPQMRERGWGRIVNIASIGGKRAVPHLLPYVASKFALVGLSSGLRTELAKEGILVTTVCPGLMRTGSPRNALFKGQHRQEFTWFSISDSLPFVSLDADKAAEKILRACQNGDAEAILTVPANLAVMLQNLAPEWMSELMIVMDRLLPKMGGIGTQAARGYQSHTPLSPSWLTQLSDGAARRNNEVIHSENGA